LLPGLSDAAAAAQPATLHATVAVVLVGAVVLIPSMLYMFALFQRGPDAPAENAADGGNSPLHRVSS
jgi:cytochrome bd ubiquinol oxidase subunit II